MRLAICTGPRYNDLVVIRLNRAVLGPPITKEMESLRIKDHPKYLQQFRPSNRQRQKASRLGQH
jgi:hypothetical protein